MFTDVILIIGDVDYDSELYNVTFAKGDTSVTFCINITDDNALEADETFSVVIDDTSLPDRVISRYPNAANVTILDNECKYLTCIESHFQINVDSKIFLVIANSYID